MKADWAEPGLAKTKGVIQASAQGSKTDPEEQLTGVTHLLGLVHWTVPLGQPQLPQRSVNLPFVGGEQVPPIVLVGAVQPAQG
jgi:hypothetical protein